MMTARERFSVSEWEKLIIYGWKNTNFVDCRCIADVIEWKIPIFVSAHDAIGIGLVYA